MNQDYIPLTSTSPSSEQFSLDEINLSDILAPNTVDWLSKQLESDRHALSRLDSTIHSLSSLRQLTFSRINCLEQHVAFDSSKNINEQENSRFLEIGSSFSKVNEKKLFKLADTNSWCNKCFTMQPKLNGNLNTIVLETKCSHVICSDCVSNSIKDSILSNDDVKCTQCRMILLKLC